MQDPYLIAEEILESIIEEGHPVEEIVNLFPVSYTHLTLPTNREV